MSRIPDLNPHLLFRRLFLMTVIFAIVSACGDSDPFELNWPDRDTGYMAPSSETTDNIEPGGLSLSGTLQVGEEVFCDGDLNDPAAPYLRNDSPESAQSITAPVTVGGFVHWVSNGSDQRATMALDSSDYFAVTLNAGDTIHMEKIDPATGGSIGIELRLADDPQTIITANTLAAGDRVEIAESNDYLIHLFATEGAFNYILRIATPPEERFGTSGSGDDFVAGEAIIRFKQQKVSTESTASMRSWALTNGLITENAAFDQPVLLQFKTTAQMRQLQHQLNISTASLSKSGVHQNSRDKTLAIIAALNQRPDVVYAEPNYIRKVQLIPNDEHYPLQWHHQLIGLENAWDITMGSADVLVAVVDSGIRFEHPDLIGKLQTGGYDFIHNPSLSLDGDGLDPDPSDPGDAMTGGGIFHGTHVAGTIAAAIDNSIGVAGVGGRTRILPIRTIGVQGLGTVMDMLQGIRYAAGLPNDSGEIPDQSADIVNLSLGGTSYSQAEADLFNEIIFDRDIVVVAAAGNDAMDTPSYPASYPGVISVSAITPNRTPAEYTNFGSHIDLAAPGGDLVRDLDGDGWDDGVLSASGDEDYSYLQGTSMAAPHVSGVVALMKAIHPGLTPMEVRAWLVQGLLSLDLGEAGWDSHFGYGLINAHRAVLAAQLAPTLADSVSASPNPLEFGSNVSENKLRLSKIGQNSVALDEIVCSTDWLHVREDATDDEGVGTYQVEVDRLHPDLSDLGRYDGRIEFDFSQQVITIEVSVIVGESSTAANDKKYMGPIYVLLLDSKNETRYGVAAEYAGNGRYRFNFSQLLPGRYRLVAGSNRDNDARIGEPGEALSVDDQIVDIFEDYRVKQTISIAFNRW